MDWTPWIGRRRPVEEDALRILTVVHQLGKPAASNAAAGGGRRSRVDTESRLRCLDHLVRHPVNLACVLIAQAAAAEGEGLRPADSSLARKVRRLLAAADGADRGPEGRHHALRPLSWERWDDAFAHLCCRGLLRVEPCRDAPRELAYRVTDTGATFLERVVYPADEVAAQVVDRCRALKDHLLDRRPEPALEGCLREVARRLESYRQEEQIPPEEDLLNRWFHSTFGEPL